ncbi:MAG: right-handed parallel beta-helix repeat-containing protein [Myxococcota bacterium]|nr:right-handed parallel beta-helix repeat-containing protein [Myxococcota bacterium]
MFAAPLILLVHLFACNTKESNPDDSETIVPDDSGEGIDTADTADDTGEETVDTGPEGENCENGTDDDLDDHIDCEDEDCSESPACVFTPTTPDFRSYVRQPEQGFSSVPNPIPNPAENCSTSNTTFIGGNNIDCTVPEGSCYIIDTGSSVVCQGDMVVHGTLWLRSGSTAEKTLLIADSITVHGEFYLTGETASQAENAEIFLRHEYCGLPENDYALTANDDPNCNSKGHLQSHAGTVKIAGKEKTPWSLLTKDSDESHQQTANSIHVDDCSGWETGDFLVVTATGGHEESWTGMINDGFNSGANAETKWKAEKREISNIDQNTCEIILDEALQVNHRGSPTTEPMPRIQAEVINQTRSVLITGGYLTDPSDPSTRVATSYDYANNSGTPTTEYENTESVPCKQCQEEVNGIPSPLPDQCDELGACQRYENESMSEYACGENCSMLGAQGITTAQMNGGTIQISHAAVEYCGRRQLAEYCLHMHHIGDVKYRVWSGENQYESYFIGNAIQNGVNKGITIHGTHRSLVQRNVIYNHRGPGIYIEDGNEIENVVEENVVICSESNVVGATGVMKRNSLCRLKNANNRPETQDSDYEESSGLYFLSSLNHIIGNRVSGYDNAMYVNSQGGLAFHGLGMAQERACVSAYPFGYTVGNVFHNNAGFGWYANTTFPQNMIALGGINVDYRNGDADIGTVKDWKTCQPFSESGADQSFNIQLYDHTEYFNDFSAGGYDLGDVSFHNYTNYGSNKSLYWKTYRRGEHSGPLCDGCTFVNTNFDLMGGSALVEFKDSHFYSHGNSININHHCRVGDAATGSLCASHFDFRSSFFHEYDAVSDAYTSSNLFFRSEVSDTAALIFSPEDTVFVQRDAVAFDIENEIRCNTAQGSHTDQAGWWECNETDISNGVPLGLRIVRIYSPDRGVLTVTNHTEDDLIHEVNWQSNGTQESVASRVYPYSPYCTPGFYADCPNYMYAAGYAFVIPNQAEISLSFAQTVATDQPLYDLLALEYSEEQMMPQTSITIREVSGTSQMDAAANCEVSSTHNRDYITPFGPMFGAAGAWYNHCHAWELRFSIGDYFDAIDDFNATEAEPASEPTAEPTAEPSQDEEVDGVILYLTQTELVDSAPSSTVDGAIPANSGNNINTLPNDSTLVTTLSVSGVTGTYQNGDIELQLFLDTHAVGQTVQARVQIDADGDGSNDIERLYAYWALDAAFGSWESFSTPSVASESGVWSDLDDATITIDLWSSFGGETIYYQIGSSYIALPIIPIDE